jgi:hypothetical protein
MLNKRYNSYLFVIAVVFIDGVLIVLNMTPPVSRDALTHHLYIPKLYLLHGTFVEFPNIVFSYFPMNVDLLYMIPLYFNNDIISKYIHFSFALSTSALIFFYLRKRLPDTWAWLGSLFFLSIPIIFKLSTTAYVDLGLIFFSTASLLLVLKWSENSNHLKYLLGAAVCCGLAVGTKYNGLIVLLLLSMFIPVLYQRKADVDRQSSLKALGYALVFVVISLLVFSPWAFRNIVWTGNPFYPLFGSIFGSSDDVVMGSWGPFVTRKILYHESLPQILLIPIRIFFEGRDNNPQFFDGVLNPFLIIFPFFAFMSLGRIKSVKIETNIFIVFSLLYVFIAFFQRDIRIRYLGPIIPPLVILSIYGMKNILDFSAKKIRYKSFFRSLAFVLVFLSFCYNFSYIYSQFKLVKPFGYLSGNVSRSEYITQYRSEFPLVEFANQQLDSDDQILVIFLGNRGYYFDIPVIFDMQNGTSFLLEMVNSADTVLDLRAEMNNLGFTHILLRNDMFLSWFPKTLSSKKMEMLESYFRTSTKLLKNMNGHCLYELNLDDKI